MKTDIIPYQKMTAEAILYKENDPLLRYAIYKAYKYRCAYTGKFLYDYSSMHLDHIIPQNTAPEVLQEKIRKYHLADDFTIDSWKSHATLTLLATQDLPTFGYNMIDPLKSWCWGSILFYPFKISRFS